MKKIIFITLLALLSGCITNHEIYVSTTKPYEGHYYSYEEVTNAVNSMHLEKDESVWIISNVTFKRVLKNTEK